MKRLFALFVLVLIVGCGYLIWKNLQARRGGSISSTGGEVMNILLPDTSGTYLQGDARWGTDKLGNTSETLASVGCAVCSVAMACTNLGEPLTPKELNEQLTRHGGFTGNGWLVWGAVGKVTAGRLSAEMTTTPTHAGLDSALKRGAYPIVKFILPHGVPHWVVIVGKEGSEYLIRDPMRKSQSPIRLTSVTSRVYSMRFVQKAKG